MHGQPVRTLYVPHRFTEAWACAMVDVLELVRDAHEEAELRRALKWLLALHDILLRLPPRGGRRSRNILQQRFAAWRNGDLGKVVSWWLADKTAAHRRLRHSASQQPDSDDQRALQALRLLSEGHVSKAISRLTSLGLGDLADVRILEQLEAKHPARKEDMPNSLRRL